MDVKDLAAVMVKHSLVLRAIPQKTFMLLEKNHIDRYPKGIICYMEEYRREMLVVERVPKNAGKFLCESSKGLDSMGKPILTPLRKPLVLTA